MTITTTRTDTTTESTSSNAPMVAHAWCTCYERDDVTPFPSLCGQAKKTHTPEATEWPTDMQNCVLCEQMASAQAPCPRCGAS